MNETLQEWYALVFESNESRERFSRDFLNENEYVSDVYWNCCSMYVKYLNTELMEFDSHTYSITLWLEYMEEIKNEE